MFPNVRLMIMAVAASVIALSCGFAVFAAFRVNHEPLTRLTHGSPPLQLAASNAAPLASAEPAALQSQLAAQNIAPVRPDALSSAPGRTENSESPPALPPALAKKVTEDGPVAATPPAPVVPELEAPAPAVAGQKPEEIPPPVPGASPGTAIVEMQPAPQETQASTLPDQVKAAATEAPGSDGPHDGMPMQAAIEPTAEPVTGSGQSGGDIETGTAAPAAPEGLSKTAASPKHVIRAVAKARSRLARKAAPAKAAGRRATQIHVAAKPRRAHRGRALARSNVQDFGFPQPNFQSAPGAFRYQTARGRRTAAGAAVGGPFVSPTGR